MQRMNKAYHMSSNYSTSKNYCSSKFKIIKISFNNCQPKTIGFRVSTSNLGHLHG